MLRCFLLFLFFLDREAQASSRITRKVIAISIYKTKLICVVVFSLIKCKNYNMENKELANKYLEEAYNIIGDDFVSKVSGIHYKIENSTDQNIANNSEYHVISVFLNRINSCDIVSPEMQLTRQNFHTILGEARMLLFNEQDNTYYEKIFNILSQMMLGTHSSGTKITVLSNDNVDVTNDYLKELRIIRKEITRIIHKSDLDFIYNGYLFHSDPDFQDQYLKATQNKTLELIEFKNTVLVTHILKLLSYYTYPLRLLFIHE